MAASSCSVSSPTGTANAIVEAGPMKKKEINNIVELN